MRKIDRLFEIVQLLRGKRLRTAEFMAEQLGVSVRTIYRDIQGLQASGVPIEGERGIGYLISQGIELPPLQFTENELRAIQLGIEMVSATLDDEIKFAANEALLKIKDALPAARQHQQKPIAHIYFESDRAVREKLAILRDAIEDQMKIKLFYQDLNEQKSVRILRPLGLEYWGKVWTLTAYCEMREDFRAFRVDRMDVIDMTDDHFKQERGKTYQDYLKIVDSKL